MAEDVPVLLVAVGVGVYASGDLQDLTHAAGDATKLRELLDVRVLGEPLLDPDEELARSHLRDLAGQLPRGGALTFLWAGHGVSSAAGSLRLLASDSAASKNAGLPATDVAAHVVASGASQLLLVLDTCYSGGAADEVSRVAGELMRDEPPHGAQVYVGVLTSCLPYETAKDGLLGRQLRRLLTQGPRDPDLRRRWSTHNPLVSGDDVGDALVREWEGHDQRPRFVRDGVSMGMLPNPLYDPDAPQAVVEHLLRAARGGAVEDERSWFSGRTAEIDLIVSWVTDQAPGTYVVTGPAGTGKSALVGRVVSASHPHEREFLLRGGAALGHRDPGPGSVSAHLHARGLTVDQAAGILDTQLVTHGTIPRHDGGRRNAAELVGAVQRAHGGGTTAVIVVDGLDEARGHAFDLARDLIARLAVAATVVVATRQLSGVEGASLVEGMAPSETLDLGADELAGSTREALHAYVTGRLEGVDPGMDPRLVAQHVTGSADVADLPFLLARLVTDQLRETPVDTSVRGWEHHVASSVQAAFDVDLAGTSARHPAQDPDRARLLLVALTWAYGAGFPEDEWREIGELLTGTPVPREEVSRLLDRLGRYVVQDGEDGTAVYRIAHQSLADHLRPRHVATWEVPLDPGAVPVARVLLERYRRLLAAGVHPQQASYLWRHGWQHAAAAGTEGLDRMRVLGQEASALQLDVALVANEVSDGLARWGRRREALPPAQEAVAVYRELAAVDPSARSRLATALQNLGVRLAELGRREEALALTQEAVDTRRELVEADPASLPDLASALNNLGVRLSELGRREEALAPSEEAVDTFREVAATTPGFVPDLASALNNLGIRLSQMGRREEALGPTQEAAHLYRDLSSESTTFLPDLAMALNNLGVRLSELGRYEEALPLIREALRTRRELAADNPGHLPDLASALNNLGVALTDLGRREEALPPTVEALELYRDLAADNPAFLPDLAMALNNLGVGLSDLGRHEEALTHTVEALDLYRALATDNPAFVPDLASASNNLGGRLSDVGRGEEALVPTQEAVAAYRELAARNPAFRPELARALNNLGGRLAGLGLPVEALSALEEALQVRRALAAVNPVFRSDLASALNNLGVGLSRLGRYAEAWSASTESVEIYRLLVAENPAFVPDLARALDNLGGRSADLGRFEESLPPSLEAVAIYRAQAATNRAFVPDLAGTLNDLGIRTAAAGRLQEAVLPGQEAVHLYRDLALAAPVHLPALATSLTNLGRHLLGTDRLEEALVVAQECVDTYRVLVARSEQYLADLATALGILGDVLRASGRDAEVETVWERARSGLSGQARAFLGYRRSVTQEAGTTGCAAWLREALDLTDDRGFLSAVHDEGRRHHAAAPEAWSAAWLEGAATSDLPAWMTVPLELVEVARGWVATASYEDEEAFLEGHPELVTEGADVAVQEALLGLDAEVAQRYLGLRLAARSEGVAAAYRPLLARTIARELAFSPHHRRRELLATRAADVLTPDVQKALEQIRVSMDPDEAAGGQLGLAVTALVAADVPGAADATLRALDDPLAVAGLLDLLVSAADPPTLRAGAVFAWLVSTTAEEEARSRFAYAVGCVLDGDLDEAVDHLVEARRAHPAAKDGWIADVARLGTTHPTVLALIPALTAPLPDPTPEDP